MAGGMKFNAPPGWPPPPEGWVPASDWRPDSAWPPAPPGWVFWVPDDAPAQERPRGEAVGAAPAPEGPMTEPAPPATLSEGISSARSTPADSQAGSPTPTPLSEPTPGQAPAPEREALALEAARAALREVEGQVQQERQRLDEVRRQIEAQQTLSTPTQQDSEAAQLSSDIEAARRELIELNDAVLLQQVGIYEYHHPLENADAYKDRLSDIRDRIKDTVRTNMAIEASDRFAYNNSLAQGRKMTADFSKLMLRAYNAEADNCVRSLRAGSIDAAIRRLDTSVETIARLGSMMQMRVTPEYHALRIEELELTSDYLFKVQEEREQAREEREWLREQRKAEQELAAERERLEKERQHYANALAALQAQGDGQDGGELAQRLADINAAIAMNDYRTANIRAGYVYVISNIGAFGSRVVKIGLTRRLEPMDRIRELGDASVPFPFDVHALYFSDDAVALEAQLHAEFAHRRLNLVNLRREFFFATPAEVREVLKTKVGNLLEFTEVPEATQYHQSQADWPQNG